VVTVSVGVASMAPQPGSLPDTLTALADHALHDAKQAGGNRVRGATSRLPLTDWSVPPAAQSVAVASVEAVHPGAAVAVVEKPTQAIPPGLKVIGPFGDTAATMAVIAREAPQVALLDVHLGGEETFGVARALAFRGVPFAFVTGDASAKLPAEFNGRAMLQKPFHLANMVKLVAQLARESEI
jgi:hypothetical protein